jgi:O-antigen/teichoic acid export membrane protein
MRDIIERIAKNSLILYSAEIINRSASFIFAIYAANILGTEVFGQLSFALTLIVLVNIFSDFGFSTLLVKKISQDKTQKDDQASRVLILKYCFTGLILIFALTYLSLIHAAAEVQTFTAISGMGLIVAVYPQVMSAIFKGLNLIPFDGLTKTVYGLLNAGGGILALMLNYGLVGVALGTLVSSMIYFLMAYLINRRHHLVTISIGRPSKIRPYLAVFQSSLPFGVLAIFGIIYFRIDTVMLQHMRGSVDVGIYNAAYRLLEVMLIIPSVFSLVLLPVLSDALAKSNHGAVEILTQQIIRYFSYISIPIAVIVTLCARQIIALFYPIEEYAGSVQALQILIWAIVAIFISGTTSTLINSGKLPKINTWIALAMVAINISLNLLWIPKWGVVGASIATVITEFCGIFMNTIYIRRAFYQIRYLPHLYKPGLASLIMAGVVYLIHSLLFLPLYLLVYVGTLIAIGGLSFAELQSAKAFLTVGFLKKID